MISKFKKLETLLLDKTRCHSLSFLSPSLRVLSLNFCSLSTEELQNNLSLAPNLRVLKLESTHTNDLVLLEICRNMRGLKILNLSDTSISNLGMSHLKSLSLSSLNLDNTSITGRGICSLRKMTSLRSLSMDVADLNDYGLKQIKDLVNLRELSMFSSDVTDSGLEFLSRLRSLTSLEMCGGNLSNRGLKTIVEYCPSLSFLNVSQNRRIEDEGLDCLSKLSKLRGLNLSRTNVSHKGIGFLSDMNELRTVSLYGCKMVKTTSTKLKKFPKSLDVATVTHACEKVVFTPIATAPPREV